ncbi:MAG: hypothetical protein AMJ53_01825 [Gammaproteobacteria bacterium SG8_11]|nr:MAG: hypothetical protein AMJ53_01825 [Gammaproteobacteria bacterium SG8_11]
MFFPGRAIWLVVLLLSLLPACGGGGSSGGSTGGLNDGSNNGDSTGNNTGDTDTPPNSSNTTTVSDVYDSFYVDIFDHGAVINNTGDVIAYWIESTDASSPLKVNHHTNGNWGTPLSIGSDIAMNVELAINSSGDAMAVWEERTFDAEGIGIVRHEVWAAHYLSGTWQTPVCISSTDPAPEDYSWYASNPDIALADDGTALAVWTLSDSNSTNTDAVYYSKFDGSSWSESQMLSNGTHWVNSLYVRIANNSLGNSVIAWLQRRTSDPSSNSDVWGSVYMSGIFTTPQLISTDSLNDTESTTEPFVSINENDQAIVVWEELRDTAPTERVYARRADSTGFVATIDAVEGTSSPDLLDRPVVSIDDVGNLMVAWRRYVLGESTPTDAWYRTYDITNSGWSTATLYEDGDDDLQLYLPLTTFTTSEFRVLWEDRLSQTAFNPALRLRQVSVDNGPADTITNIGFGQDPVMATNSMGDSVVVAVKAGFVSTKFTTQLDAILVPSSP